MCADLYLVERAIIAAAAVISAVVDSAADVLVCKFASHIFLLPFKLNTAVAVIIL